MTIAKAIVALFAALPFSTMANSLQLVCHMADLIAVNREFDVNLTIDLDRSTVNNVPARISMSDIDWNFAIPNGTMMYMSINRYTGTMQWSTTKAVTANGHCKIASQPQF